MLEQLWKKVLRRGSLSWLILPAALLWLVSLAYRLARVIHRRTAGAQVDAGVPVISVGNITVGGSGKTTSVGMLGRLLLQEDIRVGIVSSGYGRADQTSFLEPGYRVQTMDSRLTGDEVKHLAGLLPEALFSVDRSKSEAALRLGAGGGVDVIIVDDGMQHIKLHRDLEIVTFDASVADQFLKPFPLGVLREPLSALTRADVILVTRANLADDPGARQTQFASLFPQAKIYRAQFLPSELVGRDRRWPIKYLEDKSVLLFAGIGNFRAMSRQVTTLCADLDQAIELSDHQRYDQTVLQKIKTAADSHDSDLLLTTGKDWVKLGDFAFGREIYYLVQSIDLDPGEEKLVRYIIERLNLKRPSD
ncbi:MAG: tetraacyldisaccharide 4'-kinase [candidate division Zixibacteria bacterium]|nr:tetraacyldisaccharide 4'-kinase [candidate division Zixibacteria bacterium]